MDSVEIRGLACECIVGILPRERRVPQRVLVDAVLGLDLRAAGRSGKIARTVDYARAADELTALLKFRRYHLLEVAAEECCAWLMAAHPAIERVALRVEKPGAIAGRARCGAVAIERERPLSPGPREAEFGALTTVFETHEGCLELIVLHRRAVLRASELGSDGALLRCLHGRAGVAGAQPLSAGDLAVVSHDAELRNLDESETALLACSRRASAVG